MQNDFSIKINSERCRACAKCIRKCPSEAIRGNRGSVGIISKLCIGCGECIGVCPYNAVELVQDDWGALCARAKNSDKKLPILPCPTFYVQVGHCNRTSFLSAQLAKLGFDDMGERVPLAYDVSAYATAKLIQENKNNPMPLISSYCPAVTRYIQINHPELVNNIVRVLPPHEIAVEYFAKDREPATLVSPCPAIRGVNMRHIVKSLLASGGDHDDIPAEFEHRARWLAWAISGGESKHIAAFGREKINTLSVSGMENIPEILNEIELGRLGCIDYVECRACYMGCVGGVSASESRYLSRSRVDTLKIDWTPSDEERAAVERLYEEGKWRMLKPIEALPEQAPLSDDIGIAMQRLKELRTILATLPGLDCGSCGHPSCRAMAEDIVRGHGQITDCIFKLKEKITLLSSEINELCIGGKKNEIIGSL